YEPTQDTDATYFESVSFAYHAIDVSFGATNNTYNVHQFDFDQVHFYREEPGVEIRRSQADKVARFVIPPGQSIVDVPFQINHTHSGAASYYVSRYGGNIPCFDATMGFGCAKSGQGVFVDTNGNGVIDNGEPPIVIETPVFQTN